MFELINKAHEKEILKLINKVKTSNITKIIVGFKKIIEHIRADIPEKKRISYGRYSIIKKMGLFIYPLLVDKEINIPSLTLSIFENPKHDPFVRSLSVQLLSIYGKDTGELKTVLTLFEKAALDEQWEIRECSAGFVGKLVRQYPIVMKKWYFKMAKSKNAMQRRFASESLRPVAENAWLKKNPEFAFSILSYLYKESKDYPRSSVGNSLSDWMRIDEKRTFEIVKTLASNGDKNSYWIAYRACRNLVKKNPLLVMDTLKTDQYIYKDRKFYRENLN